MRPFNITLSGRGLHRVRDTGPDALLRVCTPPNNSVQPLGDSPFPLPALLRRRDAQAPSYLLAHARVRPSLPPAAPETFVD